ncbi:MAG: DUF4433 domain-containing protein [Chloroflexi bacterium]|nr:DUF4433 domain-containing protein [Chloroflexota bacterium]
MVTRLTADADKIRTVLIRHGRRTFVHWTPASAVPSILEHGLLCRRELEARGLPYEPHGYGRAGKEDDFAGHVCLGFLPHWGMMRHETGPSAVLDIRASVVTTEGTFYCPDNTARNDYDFAEVSSWTSAQHLDDLFEGPTDYKSANYQAEIWVPDGIAVDDIPTVWFRSEEDRDAVVTAMGPLADSLPQTVEFGVRRSTFPESLPVATVDEDGLR